MIQSRNTDTVDREGHDDIDALIARGESVKAHLALSRLWKANPSPATANFVVSRYDVMRQDLPLVPYQVAILRSFTVEPLIPVLRAAGYVAGLALHVRVGSFNMYPTEI